MLKNRNSVILCQDSVFAKLSGYQKWGIRKENHPFCFAARETEKWKTEWKRQKIPYKNRVFFFLTWSSKNVKNKKNGFLAKVAWHDLCQERRKSVLTKNFFFDRNCENQKKTIKIVVWAEIAQNQKWHLFWKTCFFDMGEKVGFTNCVFEKLCSSENNIFIVFSAKHSSCNKKAVCWKAENLWKLVGCFWTWQKVFLFIFVRF